MATDQGKPSAQNVTGVGSSAPAFSTLLNRQRIPFTVDPLGTQGATLTSTLLPFRTAAVTKVFLGLNQIQANLQNITAVLAQPTIPASLIGVLLEPDGSPATSIQLQFNPQSVSSTAPPVTVLTGSKGDFNLSIPAGLTLPSAGITLTAHGANGNAQVTITAAQIASNGLIGAVKLPNTLDALPVSILQALQNITSGQTSQTPPPVANKPGQLNTVKLGEGGACAMSYGAYQSVDTYPFGIFFRLVEPQLSIVQQITESPIREGGLFYPLPVYATQAESASTNGGSYTDRVPVEQPLSVDGFRDQIMGLGPDGVFVADETVPMAGTLGLGYVLQMSQQWTYLGAGLGNLVYSLPLAPGEQQQIAVFERVDTAAVSESETLSESQAEQQSALADTSTAATFDSAFNEAASGGSSFQTQSDTSSWGASILIASGGGGSSSSSGQSNSWLTGQRDTAQQAAQSTHSAAENQASARRTAARTGMRLATASEQESVTTKTITNHNHAHALTMQYWEVQRLYDVSTVIEGLTLVCMVPLQIVRFMPPGQPLAITDPNTLSTRASVLARYSAIVKHIDVLQIALPRAFQPGLNLLHQFASDPTATVEQVGGTAEDVVSFTLTGTFVPCEDITITAITDKNTRVGPVHLAPSTAGFSIPLDTYASQDDLLAALGLQRLEPTVFTGALALPPTLNRNNVIGFEIGRNFRQVDYTLISPEQAALKALQAMFGGSGSAWITPAIQSTLGADSAANVRSTVHIKPSELETSLGGPMLYGFKAMIEELDGSGNPQPAAGETYANDSLYGTVLPQQPYPVPALQVAPVLRYNELLTIEQMLQHVLRNTTRYSKAIWTSLNAEERAILLDQYTIGVPPNGIADASQMVPLLNCVQNRVMGFFGNSMIMPFMIPQSVADSMKIDPAQIQQSLLAYQQSSFVSPQSTIALPTSGVLGEAVLGQCPSAEKIDLTRFWNWQDSPSDSAPTVSPVTLPTTTPSIAGSLTAPNSLTQLPSLINNVLTAPQPSTSLLQAMGQAAASMPDFSTQLTGASQLAGLITNAQNVSNSARADALNTTKALQSQAMATVGNIVGGIFGGNPTAGSSAAAAVNGGSGGGTTGGAKSGSGTGTGTGAGTGTGTAGGKGGGTSSGGTGTGGTGTGAGAGTGSGSGAGTSGGTGTGSTTPPAGTTGSGAIGTGGYKEQ